MSRSRKKAIFKDTSRQRKRIYWKAVRKTWKQAVDKHIEPDLIEIPDKHVIKDDWEYRDWKYDLEYDTEPSRYKTIQETLELREKLRRK